MFPIWNSKVSYQLPIRDRSRLYHHNNSANAPDLDRIDIA
jgi:hypothetical protein